MSNRVIPFPLRQLVIASGIMGAAFAVQTVQEYTLPKPKTMSEEIKRQEHSKYLFQGDKRDFLRFDYSANTRNNWPKWDRRDDPEENIYKELEKKN